MTHDASLGLDELMIVNPASPGGEEALLLGADGSLYRVGLAGDGGWGEGDFLLCDDGTLYQLQRADGAVGARTASSGLAAVGDAAVCPRHFLGDDGALYQLEARRSGSRRAPACACAAVARTRFATRGARPEPGAGAQPRPALAR